MLLVVVLTVVEFILLKWAKRVRGKIHFSALILSAAVVRHYSIIPFYHECCTLNTHVVLHVSDKK